MLILVKPIFIGQIIADVQPTYVINELFQQVEVDKNIITALKQVFPEAGREIKRLEYADFYTITTLPTETADNANAWQREYFRKINNLTFIEFMEVKVLTGDLPPEEVIKQMVNLTFLIFERTEAVFEYSDVDLANEDTRDDIKRPGENLHGLNPRTGNNLKQAMLNNTYFPGASFSRSVLSGSTFVNSYLVVADFSNTLIQNANFSGADLRWADFSSANLSPENGRLPSSLTGANLQNAFFYMANFINADFSGADLRYAKFDESTNFQDCNFNNTKFSKRDEEMLIETYGDAMADAEFIEDMDMDMDVDVDEDGEANYLVNKAEEYKDEDQKEEEAGENKILDPLVIDPKTKLSWKYTIEDIVQLLSPNINNVKLPLSQMEINKWYGIASLGTTDPRTWTAVGVNGEPHIGTVFKCIALSPAGAEAGEAVVYESVPACMAVHELSRSLDIKKILRTFKNIVGPHTIEREWLYLTDGLTDEKAKLERFAMMMYNYLIYILSYHNAEESADAWAHVFDDIDKRKQFVKHAVFHNEEGIMYHPRFDYDTPNIFPEDLLVLIMFIKKLPKQIQVVWAQNYIKEFIEGYGQNLETFDPKARSSMGFIASCLNGNLEKLLLSIKTGIVQFYPDQPPSQAAVQTAAELAAEQERGIILELTHPTLLFFKYFNTVPEMESPTLEGYIAYITNTPDIIDEEKRAKYLALLANQNVIDKIEGNIEILRGGNKNKKNIKQTKDKHKTNKHKTKKHKTKKHKHKTKKHKTKKHKTKKHITNIKKLTRKIIK